MTDPHAAAKDHMHRTLQQAREALIGQLDGVSEDDARRAVAGTGSDLVGLVRHAAATEAGYLGLAFDNPFPDPIPGWGGDAEPRTDTWTAGAESGEEIAALYRRVWEHCDETINVLGLGSPGQVPWWPEEQAAVNLHEGLVHLIAHTHRLAGQADLVRAIIDGSGRPAA